MVPVTAGGVVLAYNLPDVPQELKLSRRAYAGIFLGEIKNWNDPLIAAANPGVKLPKLTIVTVVRQDSSGTTFAFTKHLDAISEKWRSQYGPSTLVDWPGNAMRAKGNEGVAGLLSHSVGGVGYVGYEFAHRYGLRTALLENQAGKFVQPTEENLRAALASAQIPENLRVYVPDPAAPDAYPIATFTWILLRKNYGDPAKAQALRDLFAWSLGDGQHYAAESRLYSSASRGRGKSPGRLANRPTLIFAGAGRKRSKLPVVERQETSPNPLRVRKTNEPDQSFSQSVS